MIYSLIQLLFYAHHACYQPYVTLYLMNRDVDVIHIGIILATNSAIMVFSQPFWGVISDRVGSVRKVFMFCLGISLILIFLVTFIEKTWILSVMFPVITFFIGPLMNLMDNWMSRSLKDRTDITFGATRLWGSISFAVMVAILGKLVSEGNINLPFRLFSVLSLITMTLMLRVPDVVPEHKEGTASFFYHVGQLVTNGKYFIFIISAALVFMTIMPTLGFLPKYIEFVRGNAGIYGLAMAISALSEVPFFYLGNRIVKRIPPPLVILTAFSLFSVRLILCSLFPAPATVLISQVFQGAAYSLFVISSLVYVDSMADPSCKATAFLLGTATYSGLSGIIGNMTGGALIENCGVLFMFRSSALISLAVAGFFGLTLVRMRKTSD